MRSEIGIKSSQYGAVSHGTLKERPVSQLTRTTDAQKFTYYLLLFLPFAVFFGTSYALAFVYFTNPVEARFAVCGAAVVPLWYALKIRSAEKHEEEHHARILTVTNGMAVLFGAAFGYFVYAAFFFTYYATINAQTYTNVTPVQLAASLADAGAITFSAETWVLADRGVGFLDPGLNRYCVAPVVDASTVKEVQYWAIGNDCCAKRGSFECGNTAGQHQKPSIVELFPAQGFIDAVGLAAAEYDLISADGAILVRFYDDVGAELSRLWWNGFVLYLSGVLCALCVTVFGTKALERVL